MIYRNIYRGHTFEMHGLRDGHITIIFVFEMAAPSFRASFREIGAETMMRVYISLY